MLLTGGSGSGTIGQDIPESQENPWRTPLQENTTAVFLGESHVDISAEYDEYKDNERKITYTNQTRDNRTH